jgi:hypothetical protein
MNAALTLSQNASLALMDAVSTKPEQAVTGEILASVDESRFETDAAYAGRVEAALEGVRAAFEVARVAAQAAHNAESEARNAALTAARIARAGF